MKGNLSYHLKITHSSELFLLGHQPCTRLNLLKQKNWWSSGGEAASTNAVS